MMPVNMTDHLIRWRCKGDGMRFALAPAAKAAMLFAVAVLLLAVLVLATMPKWSDAAVAASGEERA